MKILVYNIHEIPTVYCMHIYYKSLYDYFYMCLNAWTIYVNVMLNSYVQVYQNNTHKKFYKCTYVLSIFKHACLFIICLYIIETYIS